MPKDTIFSVCEDIPKDLYGIWKSQSKKQQKKGLNVSFAAVSWHVTQCSHKKMVAHICITSLFPLGVC